MLAGVELLPIIYEMHGGVDELILFSKSGDKVEADHAVAHVRGRARTLLECERVSLNFLQRLSGVATLARKYVDAVAGTNCKVLDTRKTTPGFRRLEKLAAAAGGVTNHRIGLFDAVLIKNNHITAAGGVRPRWSVSVRRSFPLTLQSKSRSEPAKNSMKRLSAGAWHVLLDNLTPKQAAAEIRVHRGSRQSRAIRQHHARHDSRVRSDRRRLRVMRRDHAPGAGRKFQLPNRPSLISMREIHRFASLPSTMHKAVELAEAGCPDRHGCRRR